MNHQMERMGLERFEGDEMWAMGAMVTAQATAIFLGRSNIAAHPCAPITHPLHSTAKRHTLHKSSQQSL